MKLLTSGVVMKSAPASRAWRISSATGRRLGSGSAPAVNWMQAAVNGAVIGRDPQLRVELAGAVERDDVVAAADMLAVDKDLRHRAAAAGPPDHLVAAVGLVRRGRYR